MKTFEFNNIRLGPTYGWNVTLQAVDEGDAMEKLAAMDAREWRTPQWRLVYHRASPLFSLWIEE